MKWEVVHLPTEGHLFAWFPWRGKKNFPNLEISGMSAQQGNRGCMAQRGVTSRRLVRYVSPCLFIVHDPGNQLL